MDEKKKKPEEEEPKVGRLMGRVLTAEEIQRLRQVKRDQAAFAKKAFSAEKLK